MNPPRPPEVHRHVLPEYEISSQNNGVLERRRGQDLPEHHFVTMGPEAASLSKRKLLKPYENEKDYEIGYDLENGTSSNFFIFNFGVWGRTSIKNYKSA